MTPLLSCQRLAKAFSARPLFRDITLGVTQNERLGLIGPNGSGKSTLLKILAGEEKPDSGEIARRRGLRLAYLPQEDQFAPNVTVERTLMDALAGEPLEDYERVAQIGMALAKVGFTRADQTAATLSGGWRKRLAIARVLVQRPDLLLLDEPTNHLDLEGVLWLEDLLRESPFACIVVTHDRYFLENVTNRLVELNRAYPEGFLSAEGNYSDFLLRKEAFLDAQAHQQQALANTVKREVEWLRRGPQARTTKADYRIREAGRLIDELSELKFRNSQGKTADFDFSATNRRTRELVVAQGIEKSLGERTLFSDLDIVLAPGLRLGLLGPNGSGKTTLLRLLTGELAPDAGTIKRADGLRVVYFDQTRAPLERQHSLRRALSPNGDTVLFQGGSMHVSAWASRFLFRPDQLEMPVHALSGGEQARIFIANLMLQPADLLILDEPTNDLDIASLEVLEASLTEFPGAVVLVTHDRYLLDNVSTHLLALDGEGGAAYFADYAQWENHSRAARLEKMGRSGAATGKGAKSGESRSPASGPSATGGLTALERRELGQIEAKILAAEADAAERQRAMEDPVVASDPNKLQTAWETLQAAQERTTLLYARWEELELRQNAS